MLDPVLIQQQEHYGTLMIFEAFGLAVVGAIMGGAILATSAPQYPTPQSCLHWPAVPT